MYIGASNVEDREKACFTSAHVPTTESRPAHVELILNDHFDWSLFGHKRVSRLQQDPDTALQTGDIVNLDDTVIDHPYGKKTPFLCWLYDSSLKISVWGMNLVVLLHAVLRNGLEYPLSYKVWRNPKVNKGILIHRKE